MRTSLWKNLVDTIDGTKLCVGIDPHAEILQQWALPDSRFDPDSKGFLEEFGERVLSIYDESVIAAFKPQSAFFEMYGSSGIAALESILEHAYRRQIPTVLDVKRGDIGSTMRGYASAYLEDGSSLAADAITVSPYLGVKSLEETCKIAADHDRGVFVLCLTSNPEAYDLQHARIDKNLTIARNVFDFCSQFNDKYGTTVGLVVGATVGNSAKEAGIDLEAFKGPILSPGVGAQGATLKDVQKLFGRSVENVLPSVSRQILKSGPETDAMQETGVNIVKAGV